MKRIILIFGVLLLLGQMGRAQMLFQSTAPAAIRIPTSIHLSIDGYPYNDQSGYINTQNGTMLSGVLAADRTGHCGEVLLQGIVQYSSISIEMSATQYPVPIPPAETIRYSESATSSAAPHSTHLVQLFWDRGAGNAHCWINIDFTVATGI